MKTTLLTILLGLVFFTVSFAEDVTLTTYYPSPYGSYAELSVTNLMTVGSNTQPAVFNLWGDGSLIGNLFYIKTPPGSGHGLSIEAPTGITGEVNIVTSGMAIKSAKTVYIETPTGPGNGVVINAPTLIQGAVNIQTSGMGVTSTGNVWIGAVAFGVTAPVAIQGDAAITGNLNVSGTVTQGSDIRFKRNIKELSNALDKIKNIRGVAFDWRTDEFPDKRFEKGTHIGIIAQEVEKEFPELINTDKQGYKSLDYDKFNAILLEAVKEQQKEIQALKNEVSDLKKAYKR